MADKEEEKVAESSFEATVKALFDGMDGFVSSKTVVGDAIHVGDMILLPLVDVSFGCGAGTAHKESKPSGNQKTGKVSAAGGMTGKISPSAVLVIQDGYTKLVNIKNQDAMTKLIDMVPDLVHRFTKGDPISNEEVKEKVMEEQKP